MMHVAAGPALSEACRRLEDYRPGYAKTTNGFNLPARKVDLVYDHLKDNVRLLELEYQPAV
jgi:hypothetical protein